MLALSVLLPIYAYAMLFYLYYKKNVAVSLFFSIAAIVTALYLFGLLNLLQSGAYSLFYGGVGLFFYLLWQRGVELKPFFASVSFGIYTLSAVVYLYLMKDAHFFFWDEFSHWGAFIKEMYYFGHFYDAQSVAAHLRYPPGISLWDYFVLVPIQYNEGSIYFAYFLVLFASVLMMYERFRWRDLHWIVAVFAAQMIVFATYGHWFSSIYVDHVVAAIFTGIVLSYLSEDYSPKDLIVFVLPAVFLVLVKEIGLFFVLSFSGIVVLMSVLKSWRDTASFKQAVRSSLVQTGIVSGIFLLAFLMLQIWNIHQDNVNVPEEKQSISAIVKTLVTNEHPLKNSVEEEIEKRFWEVVKYQQLHKEKLSLNYNEFSYPIMSQYKKELKFSTLGTILFFLFALFIAYFTLQQKEDKYRLITLGGSLLFVTLIYIFILYFSYKVAFGEGGLRIPSFVRYMNMAVMPLLMISIFVFLDTFAKRRTHIKSYKTSLIAFLVVFAIFSFVTKPYFKPLYSQLTNGIQQQIDTIKQPILKNIPSGSKLLVVFPFQDNGSIKNILKYDLIPLKTNSIDLKYIINHTSKQLIEKYQEYEYILFLQLTQQIVEKNRFMLQLKPDKKHIYQLYKIEKQGKRIFFKPVL